jgi:hypothetical protein
MSIFDHWAFIRSRISVNTGQGRRRVPVHAAAVELEERLSAVEDVVMALEQLVREQLIAKLKRKQRHLSENAEASFHLLPPHLQFPLRLYQLLEEFNAELIYTRNDDGIHASVGNDAILNNAGFYDRAELRQLLINAGVFADQERADG